MKIVTLDQAIKLVAELANASVDHAFAANGLNAKNPQKQASREFKAAKALLSAMGFAHVEDDEIALRLNQ